MTSKLGKGESGVLGGRIRSGLAGREKDLRKEDWGSKKPWRAALDSQRMIGGPGVLKTEGKSIENVKSGVVKISTRSGKSGKVGGGGVVFFFGSKNEKKIPGGGEGGADI